MSYTTLIASADVLPHLDDPEWAIFDCRFLLDAPDSARGSYQESHIPGAFYADLNRDLSGPILPGRTGRHPLPSVESAARTFADWGIDSAVQVVAYDDTGGAIAAARMWWMLRWLGYEQAALLDGGWGGWLKEGHPIRSGIETRPARAFTPRPRPEMLVDAADLLEKLHDPGFRALDSRDADRYRGENETIDPVAGRIPGALSVPYKANLREDGSFKSREDLRASFEALLGDLPAGQAAFYCGSGVSAAQNVLALLHAGLGEAKLYAGSWSDWILDPARPVERG